MVSYPAEARAVVHSTFLAKIALAELSQAVIAERMGVSYDTLRKVVNGHQRVTPWFVMRFLRVTLNDSAEVATHTADLLLAAAFHEWMAEPRGRPSPNAEPLEVGRGG